MTVRVITPPTPIPWDELLNIGDPPTVFLAGSIENGAAPNWQAQAIETLERRLKGDVVILNPRRADWDPNCVDITPQVEWELDALECCTKIIMYFAAATISPITLMEAGLFARSGRMTVCCPSGFFRRTNVHVVCKRYGVPEVATLDDLIKGVIRLVDGPRDLES